MGYSITLKPTDEVMEKYNKTKYGTNLETYEERIGDATRELVSYCMKVSNMDAYSMKVCHQIKFMLSFLYSLVEEDCDDSVYRRYKKDGEFYFCGWKFADFRDRMRKEDLMDNTVNNLFVLADIVDTPDFFDDRDKFEKKLREIREELELFVESAYDIRNMEIVEDLYDYRKYKDEDDRECEEDDPGETPDDGGEPT